MSYLLDTNILSETRKWQPNPNVTAWIQETDQKDLYISVLTLGELTKGVARRHRTDPQAATSLRHWVNGIQTLFPDRVLPIDAHTATVWGELKAERPLLAIDSLLAATAKVHGFTLVTRNVGDIRSTGVPFINPWDPKRN